MNIIIKTETEYDRMVNMICLTGRIPTACIDMMCADAHAQIMRSVANDLTRQERQMMRDMEIFRERKADRETFTISWLEYEETWLVD